MTQKNNLAPKADALYVALAAYDGNDESIISLKSAIKGLLERIRSGEAVNLINEDEFPGIYQWKNSGITWPDDIRNSYYELRKSLSPKQSEAIERFKNKMKHHGKL